MSAATYIWWRENPDRSRPYSKARYTRNTQLYLDGIADCDFIDLYRLDKLGLEFFSDRIKDHPLIYRSTKAGLSANSQLLIALRYFATGNSINSLKKTADLNISHGSVENCIRNVAAALSSLAKDDVCFKYDPQSISSIKQGFAEYGGFPACIGAIDGTQIKIKAPSVDEDAYIGKKEGHHINCQIICDVNLKFLDAVAQWPGSVHDPTIYYNHCGFKRRLESFLLEMPTTYKAWLIGDSGYAQRKTMMTPLLDDRLSAAETAYNVSHKRSRNPAERSIGVMKSRFRCCCKQSGGGIQFDPATCCQIVMACIVLHNYCRDRNLPQDVAEDVQVLLDEERAWQEGTAREGSGYTDKQQIVMGIRARKLIIANNFS